jgi:hypothetical protein
LSRSSACQCSPPYHSTATRHIVFLPLGSGLTIENRSADAPLGYLIVKARG